jgi:hypothetical protein
MNCRRPLKRWDRGFESQLRYGCFRLFCVCVVLCVQVAELRRADPRPRSPTDCVYITKLKSGQGPTKGCRAIDRQIVLFNNDIIRLCKKTNGQVIMNDVKESGLSFINEKILECYSSGRTAENYEKLHVL